MLKKSHILFACVLFLIPFASHAGITPLSVSIIPPVQFPSSDFTITGARISLLYGHHRDLFGLDLGLVGNITDQEFVGIGISGLANWTKGTTTILGLQLAGLANINDNKTSVYGLQVALGLNRMAATSKVVGFQLAGLANLADHTDIYGVQLSLYNSAQNVYGFQIGIVNVAETLHGIQIGLINFHRRGTIGVSPILNIGF